MTILFALAAAAAAPAPVPRLVYCHMGECAWSKSVANTVERSTQAGTLRKFVELQGRSVHRRNPLSRYSRAVRIRWDRTPTVNYVFCSRRQPALAFPGGGRWVAHALDLFDLAGYNTASAVHYVRACHGLDFYRRDIDRALRRLGYRPGTRNEQVEIATPDQLVDLPPRPRD